MDENVEIGHHLRRAEQAITARRAAAVHAVGLSVAQSVVLESLIGGTAKSCTQLAVEALVTAQTVTGVVSTLESRGLVERHPSAEHGRVLLVSLTWAGIVLADRAQALADAVERDLRTRLSPAEHATLIGLLDRVAADPPAGPG